MRHIATYMVDREARDKTAEALRHFVAGLITNRDLDLSLQHSSTDRTAQEIADVLERNYENIVGKPHCIGCDGPVSRTDRRRLARIAMYLYSDLEHPEPAWYCRWMPILPERDDLWPFWNLDEYEEALKHPRLLAGDR